MLIALALVLFYMFRSSVYAMFMRMIIECVRAAFVYGGLYLVVRRLVSRSDS